MEDLPRLMTRVALRTRSSKFSPSLTEHVTNALADTKTTMTSQRWH